MRHEFGYPHVKQIFIVQIGISHATYYSFFFDNARFSIKKYGKYPTLHCIKRLVCMEHVDKKFFFYWSNFPSKFLIGWVDLSSLSKIDRSSPLVCIKLHGLCQYKAWARVSLEFVMARLSRHTKFLTKNVLHKTLEIHDAPLRLSWWIVQCNEMIHTKHN